MKFFCRTLFCASLLACGSAWAGTEVDAAIDLVFERSQIGSQRIDWSSWLLRQQQVCEQRFAVSACLTSARRQQRAALDELRRREILLNDLERQNQAIDALLRIESNLSEQSMQTRQAELLQAQQAPAAATGLGKTSGSELNTQSPGSRGISRSASDEAHHSRDYLAKLEQARQHKQELEQRLHEQSAGNPTGLVLPK
jgi:hypothetical protein